MCVCVFCGVLLLLDIIKYSCGCCCWSTCGSVCAGGIVHTLTTAAVSHTQQPETDSHHPPKLEGWVSLSHSAVGV
jgi:hypothetical protein